MQIVIRGVKILIFQELQAQWDQVATLTFHTLYQSYWCLLPLHVYVHVFMWLHFMSPISTKI